MLSAYVLGVYLKKHSVQTMFVSLLKWFALFILYFSFVLLVPLPNWSLEKDRADLIVADLHSHSLLSHDGVVTLQDNLRMHGQRGYNLVALTNHASVTNGVIAYQAAYGVMPEAVPGMEIPVYYGGHFYLSVVGMHADMHLPDGLVWYQGEVKPPMAAEALPEHCWTVKKLIQCVHEHGGAIAVVALHLDAEEVRGLAGAGVDAFEIVNFGHHSLPEDVRQVMLQVEKEQGIALIASNDWHGWTGMLNTWTLIQNDDIHDSLETRVLNVLRQHHGDAVIPVTAYPIHEMSVMEMIGAPFMAVFQYAKTLSKAQLTAWWGYFFIFMLLAKHWRWQKVSLSMATQHLLLLGMSTALLWHGISLYQAWLISEIRPPLAWQVSLYSMVVASFVLFLEGYRLRWLMFK